MCDYFPCFARDRPRPARGKYPRHVSGLQLAGSDAGKSIPGPLRRPARCRVPFLARLPTPPCTREVPSARIRVPGSKPRGGDPLTVREPGGVTSRSIRTLAVRGKALSLEPTSSARIWLVGLVLLPREVLSVFYRGQEGASRHTGLRPVPGLGAPPLVPARNLGRPFSRARDTPYDVFPDARSYAAEQCKEDPWCTGPAGPPRISPLLFPRGA